MPFRMPCAPLGSCQNMENLATQLQQGGGFRLMYQSAGADNSKGQPRRQTMPWSMQHTSFSGDVGSSSTHMLALRWLTAVRSAD